MTAEVLMATHWDVKVGGTSKEEMRGAGRDYGVY